MSLLRQVFIRQPQVKDSSATGTDREFISEGITLLTFETMPLSWAISTWNRATIPGSVITTAKSRFACACRIKKPRRFLSLIIPDGTWYWLKVRNYFQVNRVLTKYATQAYLLNCRVVSKTGETADSSVEIIDTVPNSCVKRQRGAVAEI